jgi:hypothetical protein
VCVCVCVFVVVGVANSFGYFFRRCPHCDPKIWPPKVLTGLTSLLLLLELIDKLLGMSAY